MFSPDPDSPSAPFFIGIDSDGTVFDSMEIKHKRVFQPVAIELWGLESVAEEYCELCEAINLYSVLRGANRFEALALAFQRLCARSPEARDKLAGHEALQRFVTSGEVLSAGSLIAYNEARPDPFLAAVIEWSRRSDARYAEIMEEDGSPFPPVARVLDRARGKAEIVVVSSSSRQTLEQDWGKAGLLSKVSRIEGQEQGTKPQQLAAALDGGRQPTEALMIGDALSDLEAARTHGILFYPIVPQAEIASWERFETEALDRFFDGTYAGSYQESLLAGFQDALQPDEALAVGGIPPVRGDV